MDLLTIRPFKQILSLLKIGLEPREHADEEVMIEVERGGKTIEVFCEIIRGPYEEDRRWAGERWPGIHGPIETGFTCDKWGREIKLTIEEDDQALEEYREHGPVTFPD